MFSLMTLLPARKPPPPRRVVYTCMFGFSEHFNDFRYEATDVDFICFTDDPDLTSEFWQMRVVPRGLLDPARRSKQIKALPHLYLPDFDWSLYVDNTVEILMPIDEVFDQRLAPSPHPMICFRHQWRDCVYDEAQAVIDGGFDLASRVNVQMDFYRSIGYPARNGLTTAPFIIRRHHAPDLKAFSEKWHEQVLTHSVRDQLSLDPTAWFMGFHISHVPEKFDDCAIVRWPVVRDKIRVPRDFDDRLYLQLNPEVGIDPRKHYLEIGAAAGLRYK